MISHEKIKQLIKEAIPDAEVEVISPDEKHYKAIVTSNQFKDKSLIEQHQMVLNALKEALKEELHAISIKTKTPES